MTQYRLLEKFRKAFEGKAYKHRISTTGDSIALELYEDLFLLGRSPKFVERVSRSTRIINSGNKRVGIKARRGDGTFGEIVPTAIAISDRGFSVSRGQIATVEIGAETKILAKAMIKQIDRVCGDLCRQVEQFRKGGDNPICIGIVGINHAQQYLSFEGRRKFLTDGSSGFRHPIQEAVEAEKRLEQEAKPSFDHFLVLRFRATNRRPFPFEWIDADDTRTNYAAILTRISRDYENRF